MAYRAPLKRIDALLFPKDKWDKGYRRLIKKGHDAGDKLLDEIHALRVMSPPVSTVTLSRIWRQIRDVRHVLKDAGVHVERRVERTLHDELHKARDDLRAAVDRSWRDPARIARLEALIEGVEAELRRP